MTGPRHEWDHDNIVRIAADDTPNGCGQTIRTCKRCALIKITMHPPQGECWLEFRKGDMQTALSHTPPCKDREPPTEVKPS